MTNEVVLNGGGRSGFWCVRMSVRGRALKQMSLIHSVKGWGFGPTCVLLSVHFPIDQAPPGQATGKWGEREKERGREMNRNSVLGVMTPQ